MKYLLNIQYFGTGSSKAGKGGGGGGLMLPAVVLGSNAGTAEGNVIDAPSNADILSINAYKDAHPTEYRDVMKVLKDIEDQYGVTVRDCKVVPRAGGGLACFTSEGELWIAQSYFNSSAMDGAYDSSGSFHPSRGNKTGMEACIAHELGHKLTYYAQNGERYSSGWGLWQDYHDLAGKIVRNAARTMKWSQGMDAFRTSISRYANSRSKTGQVANWECVAEAFSDVYCNGSNAKLTSRAVVSELNKQLAKRGVKIKP